MVKEELLKKVETENIQKKWDNIVESTTKAAIQTVGYVNKKRPSNSRVENLLKKQKEILKEINATSDSLERKAQKERRNKKTKM